MMDSPETTIKQTEKGLPFSAVKRKDVTLSLPKAYKFSGLKGVRTLLQTGLVTNLFSVPCVLMPTFPRAMWKQQQNCSRISNFKRHHGSEKVKRFLKGNSKRRRKLAWKCTNITFRSFRIGQAINIYANELEAFFFFSLGLWAPQDVSMLAHSVCLFRFTAEKDSNCKQLGF